MVSRWQASLSTKFIVGSRRSIVMAAKSACRDPPTGRIRLLTIRDLRVPPFTPRFFGWRHPARPIFQILLQILIDGWSPGAGSAFPLSRAGTCPSEHTDASYRARYGSSSPLLGLR